MQPKYSRLLPQVEEQILSDRAAHAVSPWRCDNSAAVRRETARDRATLLRPAFVRDIEKILNNPYYNRYNDKTQVFSFYKNDDISRRGLHVQLVSRIARDIGGLLGLNTDLIEAIALGHDIGHTPFGHAGERFLSEIYFSRTGRHFNHNVHSARVLDKITPWNVSLQVLDGVLCHNGEFEQHEYRPQPAKTFADFDREMEACYQEQANIRLLVPMTLEGCVVRISDMIAYVGKDRQDAVRAHLKTDYSGYGVCLILLFYYIPVRWRAVVGLCSALLFFPLEGFIAILTGLSAIPLALYDGTRGKLGQWGKYWFYAFYPVHLLILAIITFLVVPPLPMF